MSLKEVSIILTSVHVWILFLLVYEPRYSWKKTLILTAVFMTPFSILTVLIFIFLGPELAGQLILVTMTIPSLIFFLILSKHRDGRFLFTFCVADTMTLEILGLTMILELLFPTPQQWVLFFSRVILYPLLEYAEWRWLRNTYMQIQREIKSGWTIFAIVSALFYLLLILMLEFPVILTSRLEYLPHTLLIMVIMPLTYWNIFSTLWKQQKLHRMEEEEQIMLLQTAMLRQKLQQIKESEEQVRIYRHDQRHRFQTMQEMIQAGNHSAALEYLDSARQSLDETKTVRWCSDPVLDAVFSVCFRQAEQAGIQVNATLSVPDQLPVDSSELSVVLFNILENAIHACKLLPPSQRQIICKCIDHPTLMFQIMNPYTGTVHLDADGRPVSREKGHGIGTRSIAAFCEKHGAYSSYDTDNGWFKIQIAL